MVFLANEMHYQVYARMCLNIMGVWTKGERNINKENYDGSEEGYK